MTRIIAGSARGRRLAVPPGSVTRPTADRTREALFSSLVSIHGPLAGSRFLDLYAGSGAVGLEAASRGSAAVVLVERDRSVLQVLQANVAAARLAESVEVAGCSVERYLGTPATTQFDVVYVDPPYADPVDATLTRLVAGSWLAADAVVVVERDVRGPDPAWPEGLAAESRKRYGDTALWYGRRS